MAMPGGSTVDRAISSPPMRQPSGYFPGTIVSLEMERDSIKEQPGVCYHDERELFSFKVLPNGSKGA